MSRAYFTVEDDFEKIIERALVGKNIISFKLIDTGWTNIVYEVHTNQGDFFFRFPRNDFWVKAIIEDVKFTQFIEDKTNFKTVRLDLCYDENRPFSVHYKIKGEPLAEKIEKLTDKEIKVIGEEIADFMFQLHNVKIDNTNEWGNLSDFLDELANTFYTEEDKAFWNRDNFADENQACFVHGDLNTSNVLLDENNHVAAIIDFGFAGIGDKYSDIARILSRECSKAYKDGIINKYEILDKCELNKEVLDEKIDTWKKIDQGYINYMMKE